MRRSLLAISLLVVVAVTMAACGSSVPSAVGSYKVTFISGTHSLPLTVASDGHFVLSLDSAGHAIRGTWSEHGDNVTFMGADGGAHVIFSAPQSGRNLGSASHSGSFKGLGSYAIKGAPIRWYGVRT
jgi:hypothetical protein